VVRSVEPGVETSPHCIVMWQEACTVDRQVGGVTQWLGRVGLWLADFPWYTPDL